MVGAFLTVFAISGCPPDSSGAAAAARDFRRAAADRDASLACSILSLRKTMGQCPG
jgi:hypothetical protein